MGRDLLAQDYLLKQITASLVYPEGEIGKKFWKRVYELAQRQPGDMMEPPKGADSCPQAGCQATQRLSAKAPQGNNPMPRSIQQTINLNTFNKVWIVPNKAVVYENAKAGTAYVVESSLKVMTEQDYVAIQHNRRDDPLGRLSPNEGKNKNTTVGDGELPPCRADTSLAPTKNR